MNEPPGWAPRFHVDAPLRAGASCQLAEDAAHHAVHVLRIRAGSETIMVNLSCIVSAKRSSKQSTVIVPLLDEMAVAPETTGVVSGEFGMAEAYERKKQEVLDWLSDPNERVKAFAKRYIAALEKMREAETKRAEEGIALRKFRFGEE
jgi:hypothetical protein